MHPESKYIFETLHVEPWGRYLSGIFELIAGFLLLVPATQLLGASLALGVMAGAIASHLFILGIVVQDDGGLLFGLAWAVAICSSLILILQREQVTSLLIKLKTKIRAKHNVA